VVKDRQEMEERMLKDVEREIERRRE